MTAPYEKLSNSFKRQLLRDSATQEPAKIAAKGSLCTTAPCKSLRNRFAGHLLYDSCMQKLKKQFCKAAFARQLRAKVQEIPS